MTVKEEDLLKHLNVLEEEIEKGGDPLKSASHDGGFATEGTNIQRKARALAKAHGISVEKAEAILKQLSAPDLGEDEEEEDEDEDKKKEDEDEDEDEDEGAVEAMKGKGVKKGNDGADILGGVTERGEEFHKALHDEVHGSEELLDVSEFLKGLVDLVARANGKQTAATGVLAKAVLDDSTDRRGFSTKIAKALISIGTEVRMLHGKVDTILEAPVRNGSRPHVLHKSDVVEPPFNEQGNQTATGGNPDNSPLYNLPYLSIQEVLVKKALEKKVDPMDVTKFENSQGDLRLLPRPIIKMLEQELC